LVLLDLPHFPSLGSAVALDKFFDEKVTELVVDEDTLSEIRSGKFNAERITPTMFTQEYLKVLILL